jgi:hypothetical protein
MRVVSEFFAGSFIACFMGSFVVSFEGSFLANFPGSHVSSFQIVSQAISRSVLSKLHQCK